MSTRCTAFVGVRYLHACGICTRAVALGARVGCGQEGRRCCDFGHSKPVGAFDANNAHREEVIRGRIPKMADSRSRRFPKQRRHTSIHMSLHIFAHVQSHVYTYVRSHFYKRIYAHVTSGTRSRSVHVTRIMRIEKIQLLQIFEIAALTWA